MDHLITFTLDSLRITDTRSRHNDTDYVSFTMAIQPASGPSKITTLTKSLGDVNNGTHKINLTFSDVKIADTDTVALNYVVLNTGHKGESQIYKTLEDVGGSLATKGLTAAGAALGTLIPIPLLGTALGAAAGWLVGELKSLLAADCDGPVAAGQIVINYSEIVAKTAKGTFSDTTKHPGSDSPAGCGKNSVYYVTWFMQHQVPRATVPDVVGFATDTPGPHPVLQNGVTVLKAAGFNPVFEQGTKGPLVVRQQPLGNSFATVGSNVTLWRGTIAP